MARKQSCAAIIYDTCSRASIVMLFSGKHTRVYVTRAVSGALCTRIYRRGDLSVRRRRRLSEQGACNLPNERPSNDTSVRAQLEIALVDARGENDFFFLVLFCW